jgi:S-adenosyl methyltransferase
MGQAADQRGEETGWARTRVITAAWACSRPAWRCPALSVTVAFLPRLAGCMLGAGHVRDGGMDAMNSEFAASDIDTAKPHPARMYDAYLGGKDNYAADREAVRQILRIWPEVRGMAQANRAFMQRAVRFLAGEAGVRQFVDIGTGIPSAGNVHEVAGQVAPGARVAYIDNDPIVHAHANALLTGSGTTGIVLADLRDPGAILAQPKVRELIDFSQPVALLLVAILHFIAETENPSGIVATFRDALPPVIFSPAASRGCGLRRPVVDSVFDGTIAA